ncbi:MAG: hypothetical protein J6J36_06610 [Clostridia bacterium]|nr:hypothetical protein [Clostridia bacterium]
MEIKQKIAYALKRYGLMFKCKCSVCGHQTIKSFAKGYDYFCPHCQKHLFTNEVNIEKQALTTTESVQLLQDLITFYQ